ncbi:MAG: thiolase domain-containing protein [Methanobacteriota archaeon]
MRDVYVVGAAQTKFGKMPDLTMREAAVAASLAAIDEAGVEPADIDGGFVANAFGLVERQGHLGPLVMTALGIPEKPMTSIEAACASASAAFREAYVNVAGGFADTFLAVGVEKVSQLDTLTATSYFAYGSDYFYEGACGATFPGLYAVMARAHMQKYGTTEEQLAHVAVKNHENAAQNPVAHLQKRITLEDVMKSMVVASPLKLYDACPFSDGAAAAIVTTKEKAYELTDTPIRIAGSGRAGSIAALTDRADYTSLPGTKLAAAQALRQAGMAVHDIDFAEVHDCFTIAEIVAMEDLGFVKPGEGGKAEESGRTKIGGDIPVNPSGGLKAKGHPVGATGLGQIVEVYKQLRGEAGPRQVRDAETALTHNVGATGGSVTVHVFERAG